MKGKSGSVGPAKDSASPDTAGSTLRECSGQSSLGNFHGCVRQSVPQTMQQPQHGCVFELAYCWPCDYHNIQSIFVEVAAKRLADQTTNTISVDRTSGDSFADYHPYPADVPAILDRQHEKFSATGPQRCLLEDCIEFSSVCEPVDSSGSRSGHGPSERRAATAYRCDIADQADRTLRPFARRLFSTSRPPLVAILARKPWFRLRLSTLG